MAGDRPIDPPTDPLDSFIEEAEARWDSAMTDYDGPWGYMLPVIVQRLMTEGFSHKILEDAIINQCDKLIQDLAERLYEKAKDDSKGYD